MSWNCEARTVRLPYSSSAETLNMSRAMDLVVIVSAKSTATTMTADEISQSFLGKSTAMKPVNNGSQSPIRSQFYKLVTGRDESQVKATWAKLVFTGKATQPKELPSSADVVKAWPRIRMRSATWIRAPSIQR
jgi:hypothetical protein